MKNQKNRKIVIVDDDESILEALSVALGVYSFIVKTVVISKDVLPVVTNFKPDLILLDYFLSGEDGTELAKILKNNKETENSKIIMFSAHPSAKDFIEEFKIDAFVAKPFDIDSLVKKINLLLR